MGNTGGHYVDIVETRNARCLHDRIGRVFGEVSVTTNIPIKLFPPIKGDERYVWSRRIIAPGPTLSLEAAPGCSFKRGSDDLFFGNLRIMQFGNVFQEGIGVLVFRSLDPQLVRQPFVVGFVVQLKGANDSTDSRFNDVPLNNDPPISQKYRYNGPTGFQR